MSCINLFTNLNMSDNKTWDGYDTFANVPINYEKSTSNEPKMSKEELLNRWWVQDPIKPNPYEDPIALNQKYDQSKNKICGS